MPLDHHQGWIAPASEQTASMKLLNGAVALAACECSLTGDAWIVRPTDLVIMIPAMLFSTVTANPNFEITKTSVDIDRHREQLDRGEIVVRVQR